METIVREGMQNYGQSLVLMVFEQGGIFIVPHLRETETPSYYDKLGMLRTYRNICNITGQHDTWCNQRIKIVKIPLSPMCTQTFHICFWYELYANFKKNNSELQ
jgi:hypothetical protein